MFQGKRRMVALGVRTRTLTWTHETAARHQSQGRAAAPGRYSTVMGLALFRFHRLPHRLGLLAESISDSPDPLSSLFHPAHHTLLSLRHTLLSAITRRTSPVYQFHSSIFHQRSWNSRPFHPLQHFQLHSTTRFPAHRDCFT
jgi:hypothetical protein